MQRVSDSEQTLFSFNTAGLYCFNDEVKKLKTKFIKPALIILLSVISIMISLYWNEARKEVVYICPNFKIGNTKADVIRQLETLSVASYYIDTTAAGERIIFSSEFGLIRWNAINYVCVIEIDKKQRVKSIVRP